MIKWIVMLCAAYLAGAACTALLEPPYSIVASVMAGCLIGWNWSDRIWPILGGK